MGWGWFLLSSWEKLLLLKCHLLGGSNNILLFWRLISVKLLGQLPARSLMLCHHLPACLMLWEAELLLSASSPLVQ